MFRMGLCGDGVLVKGCYEITEDIVGNFGVVGFDKDLLGEWYSGAVNGNEEKLWGYWIGLVIEGY